MANVQGQILSLHGTVKAIDASGKIRILKAGDILLPGERLQLEEGADIRFTRGDGQIVELDGNRQMQLSEDLLRPHNAEANESQVAALTEEAKKILASLDAPADANQPNPFDNLEPAAAGLNDAGPGNDGSTFVRVARIAESINPLQLNSSQNAAVELHDARGNAADARLPLSEQAIQATNVIGGNGDGSAIEQTQPSTSGALTASNSNNPALGFVSGNLRGEYGSLTVDATGKWTYTLDNRADALTQGQKVDDKITVTLNDGTTTTVTIHVTGTNNPAELSTGAGQVKEDTADQSQASGTLTITDKDAGEAVFVASSQTNDYGTFKIGADGKWTFDINNASDKVQALAEGEKHVETFTVASKDGTTSTVTITIVGTNDTPVFSGKDSGDVYENATDAKAVLGFDGQIVATDADHDQSGFKTTVTPAQGTLGTLTIQADGNWHYSVDNSKVQYLRSGETRDEHFTVTSLDGTTHDIVVTIHGTDNAPVFSGKDSGDVYENATDAKAVLGFDGQIVATDADHDQSGFKTTVTPAQGTLGTLTIQADGNWHYSVDNSKVQYLRSGETRDEHFTVTSLDGTTHDIVVTIHGTDNAPVFSGKDSGDVYENATDAKAVLGFDGQIVATDADHDQSGFKTTVTPAQGTLGTLTIQADGNWHYSVDNSKVQYLRSGETRDEHFTVTSLDGTTHDIVVTIHGTDNAPVFSGKDSGDVYENATDAKAVLGFDGQIVATDADHDQSGFKTTVTPAQNTLGTLTIQADGNWHYSVDNSKVQYLRSGETRDEHFTVTSLDGTTHDIVVTIHGTDNAPVFSGKDSGDVYENATDAKAVLGFDGQIVATDADHDQSGFKTTVTPAQNTLGTLTIQADGNWHYSVDNSKVQYLRSGETRDEHFTVTSLDGTTHDIVVTIHGTDNVPVFSGKDSGDVYENATDAKAVLGFDGQIVATDADHDQSGFKTTVTPAQGTLGTLTIQADGNWHYSVDNSKVQYLRSGETRDEHFTVTSLDGTTHDIVVTIHGTDNAPVFSGKDSGDVYENATDAKAVLGFDGQIVATDADHDQSGFKTTVTPAQGTLGTLTIQADGNWHYSVDNSKVQYLRSGETRDEHFTVTSLDGTTHDIVVTIHGTDNAPVFSGKDSGDVYENATDAKAVLGFDGQIVATDADHDQSGFKTTVTPAQGTLGTLTIQADGNWHYSVDNSKVQYLRSGETRDEHFTVTSLDGTTHDIVVTIHGTDNAPVFSGKDSGDVYENATDAKAVLGFDGQIVATDADHDQSGFKTTVTPAQGTLGTLTIQADGNWHYSVDNSKVQYLRSGETRDEHFTVTSLDGTTHDIVVTIHGTDNVPVFSGKDSGDVYENATDAKAVLGFDGQIVATDADHDQSGFKTTVTPAQGTLGTLTIQADGNWHYSVDNSKVQYLRSGETRDEHFTVTSLDGTTHDIVVTIHGTDNAPVFSGKDSGDVYENATDAKAVLGFDGQIVATDADHDQSGFKTTVTPAQGTLGTLTIQADGNWHYSVDNSKVQYLRSGETRDEHFTVTSLDGTTHDIVVTIHGTDNVPVFSGKDSGDVYENATDAKAVLGFDGQIVATDADHDQSGFKTTVTPAQGTLGTLTIQADGNWHYSVDNSKVQYLRSGETRDEHFTVTSLDGTTHDIVVTIHGTDNAPVFSGKDSGDVYENATDAKAVLGFDGQIVATDADHDQSGFKTIVTPAQGTLGTLTIQADGNWHYSVDNSKVQYLRSGETRDEHFTVTSLDGTTHDIVVTIHGTDNAPVFSGKDSGDVYENATDAKAVLGFDGQIVATDADHDQSGFKTTVTPAQNTLGTLTIQADGNWHYSVDNSKVQYLRSGETRDEHFTVTSLDGTTHDIVVTIHGTDNVPVFSGKDSGDVYENATDAKAVLGFDGQIVATDADHDQSGFKTTVTPAQGTLGTLTIQADGNWHYSVDNSKVQYLRSGETRDEHFTVTSLDGTTHDIVVTIHGTDNVPVFSGKDSGDVYENATDAKAVLGFDGQIVATDADHDQSGFKTTVTPAQNTLGTLTIQADGNWHYSVDNSKVQYLRSGETRDEHFTVTSLDGTTHDIVVTIHGTDNVPVFSGKDSGDVYENATDAKAVLGFDGQIVATDADHDQSGFKTTVTPAQGTLGTLTIQADGNWHYSVDNSKVQYLRSGETRDEHFTVTSLDGTTHDIVVTIHGTDNAPVFSGKDSGDVYENATDAKAVLGFDGQIVATDADHDQSGFKTTVTPAQGTLGTLTIQADGNWHYSVDNSKVQYLRSGETRDEHFTVTSLDGTTHDIVVTIHGTDNVPVFSGKDSGDVYENATDAKAVLGFDGQIVATDADHDQSGFKTTVTPAQNTLGTLTIQADGNWHYSVDNSKVQYLRSGETRDEHFTVTSLDGTTHDIVVTIHGTDNVPVFSGKDSGDVYENATDAKAVLGFDGQIVATDADHDQSGFKTTVTPAQNTLGTLTIQADGNWHYSVDNSKVQYLRSGETRDERFTVTSLDGTTHDIVVTIHGTDNVPVFSGKDSGDVYENATDAKAVLGFDGQIVATDADHDQSGFKTTVTPAQNTLGTLTIQADGNWHYSVDNSKVQYLRSGETRDEHFTVTSLDGTTHDIVVTIHGTDNVPVFSGKDSGDVYENATDAKAVLGFDGQIVATDADHDQSGFKTTVTPAQNTLGTLTIQADGNWHYSVDNSKVQYLRSGETRDERFTVTSLDGTTHDIVVTIHGTDNVPVFSGKDTGLVIEDDLTTVKGILTVKDADHDQSGFLPQADVKVDYGTFHFNEKTGAWSFTLDNDKAQELTNVDRFTRTFTVTSLDGTPHNIEVTIQGKDDPAIIGGADHGVVVEDKITQVSGILTILDPDKNQAAFRPQADVKVDYGTFHLNEKTGEWTFTLDNAKAQSLGANDSLDRSFTVTSIDGTTHTVSVTIKGTNDPATFSGDDQGAVTEDQQVSSTGTLDASGRLIVSDVDHDESFIDPSRIISNGGNGSIGTLTIDINGNWHYSVDNNRAEVKQLGEHDTLTETFTVFSKDGTPHDITVVINGVNDAPTILVQAQTQTEHLFKAGDIAATYTINDVDNQASELKVAFDGDSNKDGYYLLKDGQVVLTQAGADWVNSGHSLPDVKLVVTDPGQLSGHGHDTPSFTLVNTTPIFVDANGQPTGDHVNASTKEDTILQGKVQAVDADHDALTYSQASNPQHGTVAVKADGSWTYTPSKDYSGSDAFQVQVDDGHGGKSTVTVQVGIVPVADVPTVHITLGLPTFTPGNQLISGHTYTSWEDVMKQYGKNAITLTDGQDLWPNGQQIDNNTGYAVRGMNGPDNIALQWSNADNVLIGDDGSMTFDDNDSSQKVNDTLTGGNGNDIFFGGKGDDTFYGGLGIDTAVYAKNFSDYVITAPKMTPGDQLFFQVADKRYNEFTNPYVGEGRDNLYSIERLQFKDGVYVWDQSKNSWVKEVADLTRYPIEISASLNDRDGSEVLDHIVVKLDPKYAGAALYDSGHNLIGNIGADGTLTISQSGHWDSKALDVKLSGLQLEIQGKVGAPITISVDAVSRETANGDTAVGHDSAQPGNMVPETFDVSAAGKEDQPLIQVNLSGQDGDGTVVGYVIKDLPSNGALYSDAAGAKLVNVGDVVSGPVYFKPTADWSGDTGFHYAAKDNKGAIDASPATASIHVEAVADAPTLRVNSYSTVASINFEDVDLSRGQASGNWRQDVQINSIQGANTFGVWNTNNGNGQVEVGTEKTYTGGNSTNHVLEIENRVGDNTLYTDFKCEAGRNYQLGFDISARIGYVDSSKLQVLLIALDGQGNPIAGKTQVLYDFNPSSAGWLRDVKVDLPITESGNYRLMFQSKDADSYGAILDNLSFKVQENVGFEDSFIKLGQISAGLNDKDGSETLSVTLSGLPAGTTLKDGSGHLAVVDASGKLDVSNWSLDSLQLKGPAHYNGQINVTVTATATEASNHDQASASQNLSVTIKPVDHPVVLSDLHTQAQGGDISVNEANLANGSAPQNAALTQAGNFTVNAPDGLASLRIGNVEMVNANGKLTGNTLTTDYGTLKVTAYDAASGKVSYQYTLNQAGSFSGAKGFDSLTIDAQDKDGSKASGKLEVGIVNDAPHAVADQAGLVVGGSFAITNKGGIIANWNNILDGDWVNTVKHSANDSGSNELFWGRTSGQQSGYGFYDNDANLKGALPVNETFKLGDFVHYNYPISGNSGISGATLTLSLMLNGKAISVDFPIKHTETPNTSDPETSKDIVTFLKDQQSFDIDGRTFTVRAMFDDGNGHLGSTIRTPENVQTSFGIYGHIVEGSDFHLPGVDGNVLGNDVKGADGAQVVGIGSDSASVAAGAVLHGHYGDVVVNADGSYHYTFTANASALPPGSQEVFTYTLRDADGDTSQAQLTIQLAARHGSPLAVDGLTLTAGDHDAALLGSAKNDALFGGHGNDLLQGGAGHDVLTGGGGVDTFKWTLADQGTAAKPARDIITDFGTTDGERDVLDLADLLKHPGHDPANLSNYLDFKLVGQDTVIDVKPAKGDVTQQIVLQNVDLTHDANHAQLSDTQILKNLLDHGQLHTD